jgi:hypothetical protein
MDKSAGRREIRFEGFTENELLALPQEQLAQFVFTASRSFSALGRPLSSASSGWTRVGW